MKRQIVLTLSALLLATVDANANFYGKLKTGYGSSDLNQLKSISIMNYGLEAGYQVSSGWLTIGIEREFFLALDEPETSGPFHGIPESLSEFELDNWNLNLTFSLPNMLKYRPYLMFTYGLVEANIETFTPTAVYSDPGHVGDHNYPVSWNTDQLKFGFGMDIRITEKSYLGLELSYRKLGETKQAGMHSIDNARYVAPTTAEATEISMSFKQLF